MKIKEKILKIKDAFKSIFEVLPITLLAVIVATIIYVADLNIGLFASETLESIMVFFGVFICQTFFLEVFKKEKSKTKIFCYLLAGIIALIVAFLNNIESTEILGMSSYLFENYYLRAVYAYVFSLLIATIYKVYKDSGVSFEEYCIKTVLNICKTVIVYLVLAIGTLIISYVFIYLILDDYSYRLTYNLISSVEILVLGLYFIPNLLYSLFDKKVEIGKYIKGLVKYVLDVLVIIAFFIIYAYIVKIILTWEMPSNMVFRILSGFFVIGMPIWTVTMYFKDDDILSKINEKLPVLFIPFIVLQIYAIGVRILSNGITELRYLCVMLVIFEIIYTAVYIFKKEKISIVLPASIVLILITLVVPYVNMYKLSEISQYHNLKIYTGEDRDYTAEEIEKIQGAYSYFCYYCIDGDEIIDEYLTADDVKAIRNLSSGTTTSSSYSIVDLSTDLECFSVEGYSIVYPVSLSDYLDSDYRGRYPKVEEVFSDIDIVDLDDETISVSLLENINYYIEEYKVIYDDFSNYNVIDIDDNIRLIIKKLYISYNVKTSGTQIRNYTINGYLLVK